MKIIKAEKEDISIIQFLAVESWNFHYQNILSKEQINYMLKLMYSEEELMKHFENPNYEYYIFKLNDENFGFMGFEYDYEPNTTKLHRIYFLPTAMGRGFGRKATDFLKEKVKEFGNNRIILNMNKENPSKNFYEKCGFQIFSEGVFDIGNGFVMDDYLLEYHL